MDRLGELFSGDEPSYGVECVEVDKRVERIVGRYHWQRMVVSSTGLQMPVDYSVNSVVEQTMDMCVQVQKLVQDARIRVSVQERAAADQSLKALLNAANELHHAARDRLKQIYAEDANIISKSEEDDVILQIRQNLYYWHVKRFQHAVFTFRDEVSAYKQQCQEYQRRQLKQVGITDESKVEEIVQAGLTEHVMVQSVNEDVRLAVDDLKERHINILLLEKNVAELADLFNQLATVVDHQQKSIDTIETRVLSAKDHAKSGVQKLEEAEKDRTTTRKCQCVIVVIVIAAAIAILGPTITQLVA
jgi:t-SNARE complex subunit (syntaxin)